MADKTRKFLLVDDFSSMRRMLRSLLKDLGHTHCDEAQDGVAALKKLHPVISI